MKRPNISIIVPVYNSRKYLSDCVDSILNQSYDDYELILVDDGSNDGSAELCDLYAQAYASITTIHKNNGGVSSARNKGIEQAKGRYVLFIDSDDYIDKFFLDKLSTHIIDGTQLVVCGIIYSNEYKIIPKNREYESNCFYKFTGSIVDVSEFFDVLLKEFPIPYFGGPYAKLYHTAIIKDNKLNFREGESFAEDLEFNLTYLRFCKKISVVQDSLYYYRMFVAGSLSRITHSVDEIKKRWSCIETICFQMANVLEKEYDFAHVNQVIMRDLERAICYDSSIPISKKAKCLYELERGLIDKETDYNKCTINFYAFYIKESVTNIIRNVYRFFQQIFYSMRRK